MMASAVKLTSGFALIAATVAGLGCSADPHPLPWGCRFQSEEDQRRSAFVAAEIREGGCGGDAIYSTEVRGEGMATERPDRLSAGRYGLACRARDSSCVWFAAGCLDVMLPDQAEMTWEVPIEGGMEEAACPAAECNEGRCTGDDAGPGDGGMDAGGDDGGTDARVDARVDTGPPPDTGVDAPAFDGGPCSGSCTVGECCSSTCVDTMTDRNHCGGCGNTCGFSEDCCGGMCVRTFSDEMNCGGCGITCGGATDTCCSGSCVDVSTSIPNCGGCGMDCTGGTCAGGSCACAGSLAWVGGRCTDPATDPSSCGSGMARCDSSEVCRGGMCVCRPGLTMVGMSCVDTDSDPGNCGTPGHACGMGEVCSGGMCVTMCDTGLTACSGACVDIRTDPLHCGGCGSRCERDRVCVDRECRRYYPGVAPTPGTGCTICPCPSCSGGDRCCPYGTATICVSSEEGGCPAG